MPTFQNDFLPTTFLSVECVSAYETVLFFEYIGYEIDTRLTTSCLANVVLFSNDPLNAVITLCQSFLASAKREPVTLKHVFFFW